MIYYFNSEIAPGLIYSWETDSEFHFTFIQWLNHLKLKQKKSLYNNPLNSVINQGVITFKCGC